MSTPERRQWPWIVLSVGFAYLVIGQLFAWFASGAATNTGLRAWRLAAWVISAVLFAVQIGYERLRLRSTTGTVALHASSGAGVGAFLLAAVAIVRSPAVPGHEVSRLLALVLAPAVTMVPAFVVALVLASVIRPKN